MGRKHKSEFSKGIYTRPGSQNYWLRYTVNGTQIRKSLQTSDRAEALVIAEQFLSGATEQATTAWDLAVEKYLARKTAEDSFRPKTVNTVRHALLIFQKFATPSSPSDITSKALKEFYETLKKKNNGLRRENRLKDKPYSEGTAQGYVTKVSSFANAHKIILELPKFKEEAVRVKTVFSLQEIDRLIDEAPSFELKAILHFGFCCGMRKDEIVNIRPAWIKLDTKRIVIPAKDGNWQTKSKRSRVIPLRKKTVKFLKDTRGKWEKEKYVIEPKANGVRYRYDFRRPFKDFMSKQGYEDATPHLMRHTFATLLAEKNVSPIMISSWTGDRIKTVEKHYLHTQAASSELIDIAFGDAVTKESQQLNKIEQKLDILVDGKQQLAEVDGVELPEPWALLALEKDGEIKDPELLEILRKRIAEIPEEDTVAYQLALMTPEDRLKFYKENDIDPNEPVFEVFGGIEVDED